MRILSAAHLAGFEVITYGRFCGNSPRTNAIAAEKASVARNRSGALLLGTQNVNRLGSHDVGDMKKLPDSTLEQA